MLNRLTRKLCPLVTLALATVGCGKKINEPETQPNRIIENQELPRTMIFELDGSTGAVSKLFKMPRNGSFFMPEYLRVQGNALNETIEITYELDPEDPELYQLKCSYSAVSASELKLDKCYDWDSPNLGDVSQSAFSFREDDIIEIRFTNGRASDLKIEAIYSVDWR